MNSPERPSPLQAHELRVARIIEETGDARSLVLAVPPELVETFRYRAGQFLTLKIPFAGSDLVRAYSLASSPDWETEHKITIKRVPDGRISNWIHDVLREGDTLRVLPPAGLFTLDDSDRPLLFFAGGSGITPVISLIKSALRTSRRSSTLVYANRDDRSVIFRRGLDDLATAHPATLAVHHALDSEGGFFSQGAALRHIRALANAEVYICGPTAFMDTVEQALTGAGIDRRRIHVERFVSPPDGSASVPSSTPAESAAPVIAVQVRLDGRTVAVTCEPQESILAAVQRAGLQPPFSCTEGFCGCCMARLRDGRVRMRRNDFLSARELDEGWVLTCQAVPLTTDCVVEYPD
jgi:3-ketosteroid 9alpha-monooxygenase subunit B